MNAVLDEYWQAYLWTDGLQLTGLAMTLWLLILAVALGFLLAIPLAVARTCGNPLLRYPVWLYTYVFRGTPLYIQLLFFYTGVYSLNAIRAQDFLNAFFRDGFNCTVLAFVLNTCAYMTEIFAGAIRNTPHGEVEAARAYGMGGFTLYRRIVLPSALRRALPYFSNEVILMLIPPRWRSPPQCRTCSRWPATSIPPPMRRSCPSASPARSTPAPPSC